MMSLRPGIGRGTVPNICEAVPLDVVDAPVTLRHGRKTLPLGRYLSGKVRDELGLQKSEEADEKMLVMLQRSKDVGSSVAKLVVDDGEAAFQRMKSRERIYKKRGSL